MAPGSFVVVVFASLLSKMRGTVWLRYCGANSIVIYLAFFLPMAVTRVIIVKFGLISNIGLASIVVALIGVIVPIIVHGLVKHTKLSFLFERPVMFRLTLRKQGDFQPHPAE